MKQPTPGMEAKLRWAEYFFRQMILKNTVITQQSLFTNKLEFRV